MGLDAKVLSATKDGDGNLRRKPALHAQSSSAILHSVLRDVFASKVYAASVEMANGWWGQS